MCSYCSPFDHNANSDPYYDIFVECYAKLDAMIGTMNERLQSFDGKKRESGLLYETNPSPSSPRLEISLYDDYESSLPLESTFINITSSIDLGEPVDPLLAPSLIAPSLPSTPRDTTKGTLHLLSSLLHLA